MTRVAPTPAARALPVLATVSAVVAALAALGLLWGMATRADALRFKTLLVSGALHEITPDEVRGAVQPYLAAGFVAIDLSAVQRELEALPWVARATVRREWPGTLRVVLIEQVPVASWRDGALLNAAGEVFVNATLPPDSPLPALSGPEGTERELLEMYAAVSSTLAGAGLAPSRVALSERRAWEITVAGGLVVRLGRHDALARLQRFTHVAAPLVVPQQALVAYVDMRYTNGFAIGWRHQSSQTGTRRNDVQEA